MSETSSPYPVAPTPENMGQVPAEVPYLAEVSRLLNDEAIQQLQPEAQGVAIVDRFIGMLVADGGVSTTYGGESEPTLLKPVELLYTIDTLSRTPSEGYTKVIQTLPREHGLRAAVDTLANDPRTGQLFGDFAKRVVEKDGTTILGSLSQMQGYLDRKANPGAKELESPQWAKAIVEKVKDYVAGDAVNSPFEAEHLLESEISSVRQDQKEFERSKQEALTAGVDIHMLKQSTQEIQRRHDASIDVGVTAVGHTIAGPNYDSLFQV